jgi:hypothetical protein
MADSAVGNAYWEDFLRSAPWFLQRGQAEVGSAAPPGAWTPASGEFGTLFPDLQRLLRRAFVSSVAVASAQYQLYSWPRTGGGSCSWLSPLPPGQLPPGLYPDHRILLASFGGIVERSDEPESWILNHNDVLTLSEAQRAGTFVDDYAWAFAEASLAIPIDLLQYYSIAREANGNTTLCHRLNGEVILFAPDHAFRHVQRYPGCPEYTLYRIEGAATFREWVNTVARQWQESIRRDASS